MAPYCFTVLTFQPSKYLLNLKKAYFIKCHKKLLKFLVWREKVNHPPVSLPNYDINE